MENKENTTEEPSFSFDSQIYDSKYALTDKDLLNWTSKNGLDCGIVELRNLSSESLNKRQNFIFTGAKDDEYNKSNDHHWLAQDGNLIFDSYGSYGDYKLPENFEYFQTSPKRLQEYNTVVCGAYCCAFLKFINSQNPTESIQELGNAFTAEYELGSNRKENDKAIIEWYLQTGGGFEDPTTPITRDTSGDARSSEPAPPGDLNRAGNFFKNTGFFKKYMLYIDAEINIGAGGNYGNQINNEKNIE